MTNSSFKQPPKSDIESATDDLETERTIGLSRMAPAEPPERDMVEQDIEPVEAATQHDYRSEPERSGPEGLTPTDNGVDRGETSGGPIPQRPARMTSAEPDTINDETIETLIQKGFTREAAEDFMRRRSVDLAQSNRRETLDLHHKSGIPPFEPPER